jgi:hypothetical protein
MCRESGHEHNPWGCYPTRDLSLYFIYDMPDSTPENKFKGDDSF